MATPDCVSGQRLDLQPVDADHRMAVVHQVMCEVEACGPEADHQHGAPRRGTRDRPAQIERIPARQQRVDLEAPGQRQHVLQGAGLDLRDVDRFLLLVNAGLHAVVADAVAGGRQQRIVDRGHRQRADGEALALQQVHLRDLLFERTAGERHAERRLLERAGLAILEPARAAVLALVVAPDAIVGMIERAHQIEALVGQRKALAMPQHRARQLHAGHAIDDLGLDRHEVLEVELVWHLEQRAIEVSLLAFRIVQRPGGVARQRLDLGRRRLDLELRPDQLANLERKGQLPGLEPGLERDGKAHGGRDGSAVERRRDIGLEGAGNVALHEQALAVVEGRQAAVAGAQLGRFVSDAEQHSDKVFERARQLDQEVGFVLCGHRVRRGPRRQEAGVDVDVCILQPLDEGGIQSDQAFAIVEVIEARPEGDRRGQRGRGHCDVPEG
jgi:hypothetical protein